jgi:hypothetical protein
MNMRQCTFILVVLFAACGPAQADFIATATLSGDGLSPSTGTGTGSVLFDSATDTLTVAIAFTGLTSPTAIPAGVPGAAHIHLGPDPASNGPPIFPFIEPYANNFPLGVTSGTYVTTLTAASFLPDPADGINTFAEAVNAIETGDTYFNIHTLAYPGGEIAGEIAVVPEPGSLTLAELGLGIALAFAWRSRRLAARARSLRPVAKETGES